MFARLKTAMQNIQRGQISLNIVSHDINLIFAPKVIKNCEPRKKQIRTKNLALIRINKTVFFLKPVGTPK